ncbi:hypothetical protein [Candidatus Absconditicoccus praedator]|uniref:hypothetical protein n=1 Tax=Candidatus Absconditicoccus praedator TaxID=2735562 RepID=UPI001E3FA458|nr:hypothetical protein [Candidatus Absconditicoccus praedator]UFX83053.1 hypothetical protein HLG78_02865 [Candidatus Absconditicoccus praedator]
MSEENKDLTPQEDILDEFLEEGEEEDESSNKLSDKQLRQRNRKYKNFSITAGFFLVIFALLSLILWGISSYYYLSAQEDLTQEEDDRLELISSTQDYYEIVVGFIDDQIGTDLLGDDDFDAELLDVSMENREREEVLDLIQSTIDDDEPFLEKRDTLETFLSNLIDDVTQGSNIITETRENIGLYGFLPQEVDELIPDSSVQRALLSIESVKYFSALKVFSNLDEFIDDAAYENPEGYSSSRMEDYLVSFAERGESDVERFLVNCYLNPFENSDCSRIGDFDAYYSGDDLNTNLYKFVMQQLHEELEFSEVPKLGITLNSMDHIYDTISFVVDINTFDEDRNSLRDRGHLNPHIFITSTLINTLRGSHFISGDHIGFDSIEVSEREVTIQGVDMIVDNSNFSFDVPIQKAVESQVYDFVYDN